MFIDNSLFNKSQCILAIGSVVLEQRGEEGGRGADRCAVLPFADP